MKIKAGEMKSHWNGRRGSIIMLEVKSPARTPASGGRNSNLLCLKAMARAVKQE
ncbi:MAG: hypothetical protein P8075_01425 [Deltaproteobacteria bacterium]